MNQVYEESFLPLRFFLATVIVECPYCTQKSQISTDIPSIKDQIAIDYVVTDGNEVVTKQYEWTKARFYCPHCQKMMEYKPEAPLSTWHGPIIGKAETYCPACMKIGYREKLIMESRHKRKNDHLKREQEIICRKCNLNTAVDWIYSPDYHSGLAIDPIFGLQLFAKKSIGTHILWGYNKEHLERIKLFVSAKQRKQTFKIESIAINDFSEFRWKILTFSDILPEWVKKKKNRVSVLKAIDNMLITLLLFPLLLTQGVPTKKI